MYSLDDFDYELPEELIAQFPSQPRPTSRLLWKDHNDQFSIGEFRDIGKLLLPGDLLVVNDTKVVPARIHAKKPTGGAVEIMLERILNETQALVQLGANKKIRMEQEINVGDDCVKVISKESRFFVLECMTCTSDELFKKHGEIPLPPYIQRHPESFDMDRYQTVYAENEGAVAAPTAGLHFDEALLAQLKESGIRTGSLTLHVGAGTFTPVQTENIEEHKMHTEIFQISEELASMITQTQANGGRIVAVGTTVVRALETLASRGEIKPVTGETDIFITPGFTFKLVDALITNFHLPKSTLIMMLSAFAGRDNIMSYYAHAVQSKLRFYSYGDAMFVERLA